MNFSLETAIPILEHTPQVLRSMLSELDEGWTHSNEGPDTWSAYDVVGHLIHGEKTDWITRMNLILDGQQKTFEPYNRIAMFEESKGKTLENLLDEFESLRKKNIAYLRSLNLKDADLDKTGMHPTFGTVTLRQLLSTWAVHDLTHTVQIARTMAKQYKTEMGPWVEFFKLLQD